MPPAQRHLPHALAVRLSDLREQRVPEEAVGPFRERLPDVCWTPRPLVASCAGPCCHNARVSTWFITGLVGEGREVSQSHRVEVGYAHGSHQALGAPAPTPRLLP